MTGRLGDGLKRATISSRWWWFAPWVGFLFWKTLHWREKEKPRALFEAAELNPHFPWNEDKCLGTIREIKSVICTVLWWIYTRFKFCYSFFSCLLCPFKKYFYSHYGLFNVPLFVVILSFLWQNCVMVNELYNENVCCRNACHKYATVKASITVYCIGSAKCTRLEEGASWKHRGPGRRLEGWGRVHGGARWSIRDRVPEARGLIRQALWARLNGWVFF